MSPARKRPADDGTRPTVEARDRAAWRAWLAKHHATARGAWLALPKKGNAARERDDALTYDAAVEEALCFGWIDSLPRTLDDAHYLLLMSPRKPRGVWSRANKRRAARLIADGRMTEPGLRAVEAAKQNGSWTSYDAAERLTVPPDLKRALAAEGDAARHFAEFSPSVRKGILWWIASAKRPETRATRVRTTAEMAAKRLRARYDKP